MQKLLIIVIKSYRKYISPFTPPSCRFQPTCSQYALDAIARFGVVRGGYLSVRRICRCHPFHPGGYDPVPLSDTLQNRGGLKVSIKTPLLWREKKGKGE